MNDLKKLIKELEASVKEAERYHNEVHTKCEKADYWTTEECEQLAYEEAVQDCYSYVIGKLNDIIKDNKEQK